MKQNIKVAKELIKLAKSLIADDKNKIKNEYGNFSKESPDKRKELLQQAVKEIKSGGIIPGYGAYAMECIEGWLDSGVLTNDQLYVIKDILNMFDGQFLYTLIIKS